MIAGSVICCVCLIVMTIISAITGLADTISTLHEIENRQPTMEMGEVDAIYSKDAIVFLVMMYLFIASFACTWGPIGWIYPTELYSQGMICNTYVYRQHFHLTRLWEIDVRAQALGITTAANWLFNFGVTQLTPAMFDNIEWKTFLVYVCILAVVPVIVYRYFPETMVRMILSSVWNGNGRLHALVLLRVNLWKKSISSSLATSIITTLMFIILRQLLPLLLKWTTEDRSMLPLRTYHIQTKTQK